MKNRFALILGVVVLAALAVVYYRSTRAEEALTVATAVVTRGDIVEIVDATGTLEAVTTVQVGTQVSGTIKALYADFNSTVRRGQVIVELEPSLFQTQVEQARASLVRLQAEAQRAEAQREDAERKLARARQLADQQLIAVMDLEAAEMTVRQAAASLRAAEAQIAQARAALHQSEVNLAHTIISAPIDGVVISRNVDVGQTVAASMQAPTLFVIARDLTAMQVNASIAESDIGRIEAGQDVTFRVDAYPGDVFTGRVSQVRLEPVVEQNVVSYVTMIDVPNPALKLKPGMTANVTVEIARATDVLRIPNTALRVRPTAEVLAALGQASPEPRPEATTLRDRPEHAATGGDVSGAPPRGRHVEVWLSVDGLLESAPVRLGISDGSYTAVLGGALSEGDQVVTGITVPAGVSATNSSPLLPFGGRRPGPGGGTSRQPGR